ncbi:hypothetical protein LARI1_G006818 [Lachnellula arida]|uniref:Uncharacterized protein n=1 Tax=Lachnellula arida TaxID=1316785 RepID=A0A8T9B2Y4_9HELO|nr:hypothetical protein LARI1_G006818 [Lachnellula arida]
MAGPSLIEFFDSTSDSSRQAGFGFLEHETSEECCTPSIHLRLYPLKESEMVREITDMFAPIMKRFAIYNFWEQLETHSGDFKNYMVEEESAAP